MIRTTEHKAQIAFHMVDGEECVLVNLTPDPHTTVLIIDTPLNQIAMTRRGDVTIDPVLNDADYKQLAAIRDRDIFNTTADLRNISTELDHMLQGEEDALTPQQREALKYIHQAVNTLLTVRGGRMILTEGALTPSPPAAS